MHDVIFFVKSKHITLILSLHVGSNYSACPEVRGSEQDGGARSTKDSKNIFQFGDSQTNTPPSNTIG